MLVGGIVGVRGVLVAFGRARQLHRSAAGAWDERIRMCRSRAVRWTVLYSLRGLLLSVMLCTIYMLLNAMW